RASGPAPLEIVLYVGLRERKAGRTAVDDARERRTVTLAARGHTEKPSEGVAGHRSASGGAWSRALQALEVRGMEQEHAVAAALEIGPREGQLGPGRLDRRAAATDLDHEHAVGREEAPRVHDDTPDDSEPVRSGRERDLRLVTMLGREHREL